MIKAGDTIRVFKLQRSTTKKGNVFMKMITRDSKKINGSWTQGGYVTIVVWDDIPELQEGDHYRINNILSFAYDISDDKRFHNVTIACNISRVGSGAKQLARDNAPTNDMFKQQTTPIGIQEPTFGSSVDSLGNSNFNIMEDDIQF